MHASNGMQTLLGDCCCLLGGAGNGTEEDEIT